VTERVVRGAGRPALSLLVQRPDGRGREHRRDRLEVGVVGVDDDREHRRVGDADGVGVDRRRVADDRCAQARPNRPVDAQAVARNDRVPHGVAPSSESVGSIGSVRWGSPASRLAR